MIKDLYTPMQLSTLSAWREGYRFAERRDRLQAFGQALAASGLMKKGVPVPAATQRLVRFLIEQGPYDVRTSLSRAILGEGVRGAMRRDADKFGDAWQRVPWHYEAWFMQSGFPEVHSLHVSTKDANLLAYAESLEKLVAERYTQIKPGKYLTRFFSDVLSEVQIKEWAEKFAARNLPAELRFIEHDDPDGWIRVYRDGPNSCMQGEDSVQVYAHEKSVLRLAYLEKGDEIIARAITRKDKMEYIRIYPGTDSDENQLASTAMKSALTEAGYSQGSLRGVKLRMIECRGGDGWVMPYLDGNYTNAEERDGCWVIGSSGIDCQTQDGYIEEECHTCNSCGDRCDEDDLTYVDCDAQSVCENCLGNDYVYAYVRPRHGQEYVRADDATYCHSDGEHYDNRWLTEHDVYECQIRGKHYALEDLCLVSSCGYVHESEAVALDVEDDEGNCHALPGETVEDHQGRTCLKEDCEERDGVWWHKDDTDFELDLVTAVTTLELEAV